jgi:DNA-directed RNA polymerase subunit M/transcription elongation factor TFIIS
MVELDYLPLYVVRNSDDYGYKRMMTCACLGKALSFIVCTESRDYILLQIEDYVFFNGKYHAHMNQIINLLERNDVQHHIMNQIDNHKYNDAVKYITSPITDILPKLYEDINIKKATKIEAKITKIYKCINCHSRKITTTNVQIRSLDEGASISFTCVDCGHEWVRG